LKQSYNVVEQEEENWN